MPSVSYADIETKLTGVFREFGSIAEVQLSHVFASFIDHQARLHVPKPGAVVPSHMHIIITAARRFEWFDHTSQASLRKVGMKLEAGEHQSAVSSRDDGKFKKVSAFSPLH